MNAERDDVIAQFLREYEAPAPHARFWNQLASRLEPRGDLRAGVATAPAGGRPSGDEDFSVLDSVELRARRGGRAILVAGCAAVLVAILAVARIDTRGTVRVQPADTITSQPARGTDNEARRAVDAVMAWIDAVHSGNVDAAWHALAEGSRDAIGGRAGFEEVMRSALREGWGTWAAATSTVATGLRVAGPTASGDLWIVALDGVLTQEGSTTRRVAAVPVWLAGGRPLVDPFRPGRSIGLIGLDPLTTERVRDGTIPVHLDGAAMAIFAAVDGREVDPSRLEASGDGTVERIRLDPATTSGDHVLVVAVLTAGGGVAADAVIFNVA